jgi:UDPglucose 6-dehydrogenase
LSNPLIVDLRNIYRPDEMRRRGFTYVSVGRPA